MKKTFNYRGLFLAAMAAFFVTAGATQTFAHDYYNHDNGYWDHHHNYHPYSNYHHHRGYWDQRNGVRVFINL